MDLDEMHESEEVWTCPGCGMAYHEDDDAGTLMNLGGVAWEDQPTYCRGCAGEVPEFVEGYGVL